MSPAFPVHAIRLGKLEAQIWERRCQAGCAREADYHVSIRSVSMCGESHGVGPHCRPADGAPVALPSLQPDELPVLADLTSLTHLWIQEQVFATVD